MDSFFTWASFGTLGGASFGIVVVGSTLRRVLKLDTVWIPFILSILVAAVLSYISGTVLSVSGVALAVLNSCLLFCTALGMNDGIVSGLPKEGGGAQPYGARRVTLVQHWLRGRDKQPNPGAGDQ